MTEVYTKPKIDLSYLSEIARQRKAARREVLERVRRQRAQAAKLRKTYKPQEYQ
jgi:hypothetical protein